jgi:hypothetical protein
MFYFNRKKSFYFIRLKQNLPNLVIFIPSNIETSMEENYVDPKKSALNGIHERNAIQILTNSCVKSHYNLEFELKTKSNNNSLTNSGIIKSKSSKIILSANSEFENDVGGDQKHK